MKNKIAITMLSIASVAFFAAGSIVLAGCDVKKKPIDPGSTVPAHVCITSGQIDTKCE